MKSNRNRTVGIAGGQRWQQGTPRPNEQGMHRQRAYGLKLRAAVIATYVQVDEEAFPGIDLGPPVAVYCDVIAYGNSEGMNAAPMRRVPVYLDAGMHEGRIWKPRAATIDMTGDLNQTLSQPYNLDGDHVLIEFMEDDLGQPFIGRRVNHPRMGQFNDEVASDDAGHRMRLKVADGNPDLIKHRGSFYGVDDSGNLIVDTTRAHGGEYTTDGQETPADDPAHGSVIHRVARTAKFIVEGRSPDAEDPEWFLEIDGSTDTLKFYVASGTNSLEIQNVDGDTLMSVGDGAQHVAIVEHLQTLYESLKSAYDAHTHTVPDAVCAVSGGSGAPAVGVNTPGTAQATTSSAPDWDGGINSTKVSIPDG